MTGLPEGWAAATLDDVAIWGSGGTPNRNRADYFGGSIPWIKTGELGEKYVHSSEETLSDLGLASSSAKVFPRGSVAIAMYGATIGKLSIWGIDAATNQACAVAQPKLEAISTLFLYYFLQSEKRDLVASGKGGAQPNISQGLIREWPLPLPPLPEQYRIVAKIEELFSELDAGTASLTRARAQLKTYRQALLKAAFEGKLTSPWRAANPDKLETPETLLSRIRTERDARYAAALDDWQTALSEWRAGGEMGRKPGKPERPAEIASPSDAKTRADLPQGWLWCTVEGLLAKPLTNGRSVKDKVGGFPVLRLTAFQAGRLNLSEFKEGDWTEAEAASWLVEDGDFFAARGNGSKHLVGIGALASEVTQAVAYPDTMIRIAIDDALVNRDYFALVWNSRVLRNQIEAAARTTAGIYKINQPHICGFAFPLPPREEQDEVLLRIVPILSNVDHQESEITTALAKITALRQSILKKAFSGQLVVQDPTDEPASALLARLAQTPAPKPRRKTKP